MTTQGSASADYPGLFLRDTPLLDVRAPAEFVKGAFPLSTNLPLLDDQQRALIGTRYRESGQEAAIELGWSLATPEVKSARQQVWSDYIRRNPQGYLYCWRGGLRSRIAQQLIAEMGGQYPRIVGGYKAMRQYLLDSLQAFSRATPFVIIAGRACSGKTRLLAQLGGGVDLEGLARHRGSAFGGGPCSQPSQIDFENALAITLLKHNHFGKPPLLLEDEGKLIGRCSLPVEFRNSLCRSPRVIVHTPLQERIQIALRDYVSDKLRDLRSRYEEQRAIELFAHQSQASLHSIRKRLGGDRYQAIRVQLQDAITDLRQHNSIQGFVPVIHSLLLDYYDPMYDYQLNNKGAVLFEGSAQAIQSWMRHYRGRMTGNAQMVEASN